mmetsp:Transcript_7842/g.14605  ORF Transcript_7842/g.14605 Transcript_7842/m.14605 type:complete len:186 (-) Transcript_7842:123-680(-)
MNLVTACSNGDISQVARELNWGANPDEAWMGVRPLQTAIEEGHVDVVAMLLHKGVSLDVPVSRGKMPKDLAETLKDKEKSKVIIKLLSNETFRAEYQPGLMERLKSAELEADEAQKRSLYKAVLLLIAVTCAFACLCVLVWAAPQFAAQTLPAKLVQHVQFVLSGLGVQKDDNVTRPMASAGQEL